MKPGKKILLVLSLILASSFGCHASKEKAKADSQVRFEMGKEYLTAGENQKALAEAESAITLYPENYDAWFLKAETLAVSKQHGEALKAVESGATHLPPEELFRKDYMLGVVYHHKGDLEPARDALVRSSGANPKFIATWSLLGQVYTKLKNIDEAVKSYTTWTEQEPKNDHAWDQLGITLVWARKFDVAKGALDKALELNPKSAVAYNYLGTWAEEQDKFGDAEQYFARSISLDGKNPYAQLNMGQLLMLQKRGKDAFPFLTRAVELQKDNVYALFWLAKYHQGLKEFAAAADKYEQALVANAEFWAARMGLAEAALADASLSARAEKALAEGMEKDKRNQKGYLYYLARLKLAAKDPKAALEYTDKAAGLLQKTDTLPLADLHLLRGQIFDALRRPGEAQHEYWQAVKTAPRTPVAREAQRHIRTQ